MSLNKKESTPVDKVMEGDLVLVQYDSTGRAAKVMNRYDEYYATLAYSADVCNLGTRGKEGYSTVYRFFGLDEKLKKCIKFIRECIAQGGTEIKIKTLNKKLRQSLDGDMRQYQPDDVMFDGRDIRLSLVAINTADGTWCEFLSSTVDGTAEQVKGCYIVVRGEKKHFFTIRQKTDKKETDKKETDKKESDKKESDKPVYLLRDEIVAHNNETAILNISAAKGALDYPTLTTEQKVALTIIAQDIIDSIEKTHKAQERETAKETA